MAISSTHTCNCHKRSKYNPPIQYSHFKVCVRERERERERESERERERERERESRANKLYLTSACVTTKNISTQYCLSTMKKNSLNGREWWLIDVTVRMHNDIYNDIIKHARL